ncbi:hypothetical protein D4764_17G0009350 [Takifugu flavidus]|uniref:Uncharacterized protein n=1 Tax=Takifugu flavidus TaxID=433684 RepID=A0A5C6NVC3_9TELE|nr:hypothetical protein D4764_17G0009350 [Takifugu flavidus]
MGKLGCFVHAASPVTRSTRIGDLILHRQVPVGVQAGSSRGPSRFQSGPGQVPVGVQAGSSRGPGRFQSGPGQVPVGVRAGPGKGSKKMPSQENRAALLPQVRTFAVATTLLPPEVAFGRKMGN